MLLLAQFWLSSFNHFQDVRRFNVSHPHPHPSVFPGLRLLRLEFLSSFIEKLSRMEKTGPPALSRQCVRQQQEVQAG